VDERPLLLLTGAAGGLGRELVPRLRAGGFRVRALDLSADGVDADEVVTGSVTDVDVVDAALAGVDAVVHLAGMSKERAWPDVLHANVHGTWVLLDACVRAGVGKVAFASSNHAVGLTTRPEGPPLAADTPFRPDSYYGWSKTAGESLCRLFVDRAGLDVVVLRIGSCFPHPGGVRGLSTWMSYDDCARLVTAAVDPAVTGWHCVWGVSANTRRWWSLAEGEAIGYHPQDDSERFAAEVFASEVPQDDDDLVGGDFHRTPLGEPN
jgi:nucleoside-diphosphate-sugar epimerase